MTEMKLEAASEKRRRSRPRLLSAREELAFKLFDVTTDRARQNYSLAVDARKRLTKLAAEYGRHWDWLLGGRHKQAILVEIARIPLTDDATMIEIVDFLCEKQMSAKHGAAVVRQMRLGHRPMGSSGQLGRPPDAINFEEIPGVYRWLDMQRCPSQIQPRLARLSGRTPACRPTLVARATRQTGVRFSKRREVPVA